jgi:hypothetical protein
VAMYQRGQPVVALDIDGTLGDYHGHFWRFAQQWTGRTMRDPALMPPDIPFFRYLGMSKAAYRQCKLAYRQGGMKRSMPVYPGVSEMTKEFRRAGASVWLCTTRPYLRLDNIDPDTRHWLRRNSIQYDGMLFGTYKYRDLVNNVGVSNVLAVLDDLPEQCSAAKLLGLPAYIRDETYNKGADFPRVYGFTTIEDPWRYAIVEEIKWRAKQWRESGS